MRALYRNTLHVPMPNPGHRARILPVIQRKKSLAQYHREKLLREGKPLFSPRKPPKARNAKSEVGRHPSAQGQKQTSQRARASLKKVGPRTLKRQAMNRELNKLGIDRCEIRLPGCWNRTGLTWAHALKSRFLKTDEDWMRAARACLACHQIIEAVSHTLMAQYVDSAIALRVP